LNNGETTPRDLVRQTLEFDAPARVPRPLLLLPWARDRYPDEAAALQEDFPDDIVKCECFLETPLAVEGDRYRAGRHVDEWGCLFENIHSGAIGQVKKPLVAGWGDLDRVRIPEERLTVDRGKVDAFCRATDRFVIAGCCPRPFEQLQFIRGTENLLIDLIDRPVELELLIGRMHDLYMRELELWADTGVDAVMFMDDWGTQRSMLVNPDLCREIFMPLYADYVDLAHGKGKYIFMHSDGYIADIVPDLIDTGLDAINSQVWCMGVRELGARFGGRITFWGEPDRQRLLPSGTPGEVRAAALEMKRAFDRAGGVIALCEFGLAAKPENIRAFFEAW